MRYILDVSTSLGWRGRSVGVVRTERELLREFLAKIKDGTFVEDIAGNSELSDSRPKVAFCHFSKVLLGFYYISAEQAAKTLTPAWENPPDTGAAVASSGTQSHSSRRTRTVRQVVAPLARKWMPPPLLEAMKRAFPDTGGSLGTPTSPWAHMAARGISRIVTRSQWGGSLVEFDPKTVYVSVGADWDYNNYTILYRLKKTCNFVVVLCAYDMIPVLFPHLCLEITAKNFRLHSIDKAHLADLVLSISETTTRDFRKFLADESLIVDVPVKTVILGDSIANLQNKQSSNWRKKSYFLYVSTIEARKNHTTLLKAWELLADRAELTGSLCVLVGHRGWGTSELLAEMKRNPRLSGRVAILDSVSEEMLDDLYSNCCFTVFPSIYEGWGLAVAESLRYGKAVIISDAPALSEASQGLVPVVNWYDIGGWSAAIEKMFLDVDYRRTVEDGIKEKFCTRSWRQYSADVVTELEHLAK